MKILAFNTVSDVSSISLYVDGNIVDKLTIEKKRENSAKLVPLIKQLIDNHGLTINDLDIIIASKGPGSFTGIRIGLSVLVGFQISKLNAKIYAPSSFDILKAKYLDKNQGSTLVSVDSGRGDFFVCGYNNKGNVIFDPANVSAENLDSIKKSFNCERVFSGFDSDDMINWALQSEEGELEKPSVIEPFYIRPPDVTIKK